MLQKWQNHDFFFLSGVPAAEAEDRRVIVHKGAGTNWRAGVGQASRDPRREGKGNRGFVIRLLFQLVPAGLLTLACHASPSVTEERETKSESFVDELQPIVEITTTQLACLLCLPTFLLVCLLAACSDSSERPLTPSQPSTS